jgi:hypothetical protein
MTYIKEILPFMVDVTIATIQHRSTNKFFNKKSRISKIRKIIFIRLSGPDTHFVISLPLITDATMGSVPTPLAGLNPNPVLWCLLRVICIV